MDVSLRVVEKFWAKTEKGSELDCWMWRDAPDSRGYGQLIWRVKGRQVKRRAHQISLALHGIEVPQGWHIHHICGEKLCVNPYHLEILTPSNHSRREHLLDERPPFF